MEGSVDRRDVEIVRLTSKFTSIRFVFPQQQQQITVDSATDLIADFFLDLSALYFSKRIVVTPDSLAGNLLSCDESAEHLCGTIIPLPLLSKLCEESLKIESIKAFLHVCSCLLPLKVDEQGFGSSGRSSVRHSVELPANSIWTLLVLSEGWGVRRVLKECKERIAKLFLTNRANPARLPSCVLQQFDLELASQLETRLLAHLLRFGKDVPENDIETMEHVTLTTPHSDSESENGVLSLADLELETQFDHSYGVSQDNALSTSHFLRSIRPSVSQPPQLPVHSSIADELSSNTSQTHSFRRNSFSQRFLMRDESNAGVINGASAVHKPHSHATHRSQKRSSERVSIFAPSFSISEPVINTTHTFSHSNADLSTRAIDTDITFTQSSNAAHITSPNASTFQIDEVAVSILRRENVKKVKAEKEVKQNSDRTLSAEDLRVSREIALLRVREAKTKSDLEISKLSAEKSLRDNRLKSLELKAAVLRIGEANQRRVRRSNHDPSPIFDLEQMKKEVELAEEARKRALDRIKEKKREIEESERKEEQEKQQRKLNLSRDKKIAEIQKKQCEGPPPNTDPSTKLFHSNDRLTEASSSLRTPASLIKASNMPSPSVDDLHSRWVYSREALEAVGLGLSPSVVSLSPESLPKEQEPLISNHSLKEWLAFTIIRASKLPECLGGTNPYVVVHIPSFGQTQTQIVNGSTEPFFGAMLLLRSPLSIENGNEYSQMDDDVVNIGDDASGTKVQFIVFNKNPSLCDDLIGFVEIDVGTLLESTVSGSMILELVDGEKCSSGYVEVLVRRELK